MSVPSSPPDWAVTGPVWPIGVDQAFQWVVGSLGLPGFLVGLGWVHWVGLALDLGGLGWAGNVPDPGYPANPTKILPKLNID